MNNNYPLMALSMLVLAGCGGSDSKETGQITTPVASNGVPELNAAKLSLKPLKSVQELNFETHFKNGIYLSALNDNGIRYLMGDMSSPTSNSSSQESASGSKFSTTVTQESGVDEADRIKYNGDYLYIANNGGYLYSDLEGSRSNEVQPAHIRVMKRNADKSMSEVSTIKVSKDENYASIDGIYLNQDTLGVISSSYQYYLAASSFDIWHPGPQSFSVSLFDVSTPDSSSTKATMEVDGYLISSRRVENQLILVSSFNPSVEGLVYLPQTDKEKADNFKLIKGLDVNSLLPQYKDKDGNKHNLVTADNCFIPEDATNKDGYDGIVTLTTINLDDPTQMTSVCVNATTQGIYASPQSVYMYGSADSEQSVVHKFAVNGQQINYQASTNFDGHLFGRGASEFRFSESGDYLRVVATEFTDNSEDRFEHKLMVFNTAQGDNSMKLVAEIPNEAQPAKLGKPNEDIYAVRYFGNKAFIVTFESIDPLYVIDLSDNLAPRVDSELEIVGYSSYLHPINDSLILGIGQNIDPNRFRNTLEVEGSDQTSSSSIDVVKTDDDKIAEGAKVALFDVSGDARLVGEIVFEGGFTPAEYNHHALTYLAKSANEHQFAIPVESWSTTFSEEHGYDIWTSNSQLQLFEVKVNGASGELLHVGSVSPVSDNNHYYGSWDDRAIFHDDIIYYVHGSQVWQSLWSDPKNTVGPF